jgi:hypothetical protein
MQRRAIKVRQVFADLRRALGSRCGINMIRGPPFGVVPRRRRGAEGGTPATHILTRFTTSAV